MEPAGPIPGTPRLRVDTDGICRNVRADAGLRLLAIVGVNEDGTQEALRRTWTAAIREGTDRGFDSTPERFGDKRPKVIWGAWKDRQRS